MRTATQEFEIYTYKDLNDKAKENVKRWLLDDDFRCKEFAYFKDQCLAQDFPNSSLSIHFSLSSCQGDGLNIEGTVKLYDVLPKLEGYSEKEIKTLEHYFEKTNNSFTFESNSRYAYSCKFLDARYIDNYVSDAVEELKCWQYRNINVELIKKFYSDMFEYFEKLDRKYEKDGYEYLYEMDEEEAEGICEANDYEFFEDGSVYKKVYAFEF